ncbi:hypothetical protein EV426DRAFT_312313 [Tirmania nivea]|nr:hypothetical protein EV426DRAFT_312313 [Tirmania nivea]
MFTSWISSNTASYTDSHIRSNTDTIYAAIPTAIYAAIYAAIPPVIDIAMGNKKYVLLLICIPSYKKRNTSSLFPYNIHFFPTRYPACNIPNIRFFLSSISSLQYTQYSLLPQLDIQPAIYPIFTSYPARYPVCDIPNIRFFLSSIFSLRYTQYSPRPQLYVQAPSHLAALFLHIHHTRVYPELANSDIANIRPVPSSISSLQYTQYSLLP